MFLEGRATLTVDPLSTTQERTLLELDQSLAKVLLETANGKTLDLSGKAIKALNLELDAKERLEQLLMGVREPIAADAVQEFADGYRIAMKHLVATNGAPFDPYDPKTSGPNGPKPLSPEQRARIVGHHELLDATFFERSRARNPLRQLHRWVDLDNRRFLPVKKLEHDRTLIEPWQAVFDSLHGAGEVRVLDTAHRLKSGGGSLGIHKHYVLIERASGELELWHGKESTASAVEAHSPLNVISLRAGDSRPLSDLNHARRGLVVKTMHEGNQLDDEFAVRLRGHDFILSERDSSRVTFDADKVRTDQLGAVSFFSGVRWAVAHYNGFHAAKDTLPEDHPERNPMRLLAGIDDESFLPWMMDSARSDSELTVRFSRLLREIQPALKEAVKQKSGLPPLASEA
ncbi:MAG: DUF2252 family protein [Myxococcota bacterium]